MHTLQKRGWNWVWSRFLIPRPGMMIGTDNLTLQTVPEDFYLYMSPEGHVTFNGHAPHIYIFHCTQKEIYFKAADSNSQNRFKKITGTDSLFLENISRTLTIEVFPLSDVEKEADFTDLYLGCIEINPVRFRLSCPGVGGRLEPSLFSISGQHFIEELRSSELWKNQQERATQIDSIIKEEGIAQMIPVPSVQIEDGRYDDFVSLASGLHYVVRPVDHRVGLTILSFSADTWLDRVIIGPESLKKNNLLLDEGQDVSLGLQSFHAESYEMIIAEAETQSIIGWRFRSSILTPLVFGETENSLGICTQVLESGLFAIIKNEEGFFFRIYNASKCSLVKHRNTVRLVVRLGTDFIWLALFSTEYYLYLVRSDRITEFMT